MGTVLLQRLPNDGGGRRAKRIPHFAKVRNPLSFKEPQRISTGFEWSYINKSDYDVDFHSKGILFTF